MKIRLANKKDLNNYILIKNESLKEYSKITQQSIKLTNLQIKKELTEGVSNPKRFLIVIGKDKRIIGYLIGSILISEHQNYGYIDDIFILKEFRKKGLGVKLINDFIKKIKKKKVKRIRLGVNIKNKNAIKVYKKLGFKIRHYEMDKELK